MRHRFRLSILLTLLACAMLTVGAFIALPLLSHDDTLQVAGSPFTLHGPLRAYWEAHTGTSSLGPPRSAQLWRDGQAVQYFDQVVLKVDKRGDVQSAPLSADWRSHLPPELLSLDADPQQAEVVVDQALRDAARPLQPITLTLEIAGYTGSAQVRLYDARVRSLGVWQADIHAGKGQARVLPGGALGAQQVVVLIDHRIAGVSSNAYTLDAETDVHTGLARFDTLFRLAQSFLARSTLTYQLNGQEVHGYRSPDSNLLWLRDHTYQERGFRYFDPDVKSLINAFRHVQKPDGSFPDYLTSADGHIPAARMPVEADVEYLFVQAVYQTWQATGDDAWLRENLPAMRKALHYTMSDPLRWDAAHGLVKRPYTIDTWDFEVGPSTASPDDGQPAPRHWIDDQTKWSIFHGDNTGLASVLELLARTEEQMGDGAAAADHWRTEANGIMQRLNALSWNGRFFTHQVGLEPFEIPGVDERNQLSLSNALALNRGVLEGNQANAIISEYYRRYQERGTTFAEWYSIDPPFPAGSIGMGGRKGEQPGEYVNGGILPLVGGELARGAFHYGREEYGLDILARYTNLISPTQSSYLWYYPLGNPGISSLDTLSADGWGSSAMLAALMEGAAGVVDNGALYQNVTLSPSWAATPDAQDVSVTARYAASTGYLAYRWQRGANGLTLHCTGSGEKIHLRLLLPGKPKVKTLLVNGTPTPITIDKANDSRYVVVDLPAGMGTVEVGW